MGSWAIHAGAEGWTVPPPHTYSVEVRLYKDGNGVCVYVPRLPGCVSQGEDLPDALANIREALEGVLMSYRDAGGAIPWQPRQSVPDRAPFEEVRHVSVHIPLREGKTDG